MDAVPQTQTMVQPALAGIRVVDLTQFEAGTSITETLAWLGADVIKIENPLGGEQGRNASSERKADDFAENFAPGVIEKLGFSYEEVSAINPRIIYATVKGFGKGSPYESNLAFDMIAQAAGGVMSITGEADGR